MAPHRVDLHGYVSHLDVAYIPQPRPKLVLTAAYRGKDNKAKLRAVRATVRRVLRPAPLVMPYQHDGYGFPSGAVRAFYISDPTFRAHWRATHVRKRARKPTPTRVAV